MALPAGKIGLIAGQGILPKMIADAICEQQGELFVLAIHGDTRPELTEDRPHQWIEMSEIALTLDIFKQQGVEHIIMAGKLSRPPMKALKPPALAAKILKRIGASFFKGDDALFKAIISIFEEEGFHILGADEVLAGIVTEQGVLTAQQPGEEDWQNIELAAQAAQQHGAKDLGQAVIVKAGGIIAREGIAGTDAMLQQVIGRQESSGAILAKMKKPNQERRVDLPAIGPETIRTLAEGHFRGVVLQAGHSLILNKPQVLEQANAHQLFVVGVE